jgi:hypothetical protein
MINLVGVTKENPDENLKESLVGVVKKNPHLR